MEIRLLPAGAAAGALAIAALLTSPFGGFASLTLAAGLIASLIVSAAIARRELTAIDASMRAPDRIFAGDPWSVTVSLRATDKGWGSGPFLVFLREVAVGHPDGAATGLRPGQEARIRIARRACGRGLHALPPLWLVSDHPFGLIEARRRIALARWIAAAPRPGRLAAEALSAPLDEGAERGDPIPAPDPGIVRPWHPGDDPRRIHWRTSARRGRLHVIEPSAPPAPARQVVVDDEAGPATAALGESALRLAATIAAAPGATGHVRYARLSWLREAKKRPWLADSEAILRDLARIRWRLEPAGAREIPPLGPGPTLVISPDPGSVRPLGRGARTVAAGTPEFRRMWAERTPSPVVPHPSRKPLALRRPAAARIAMGIPAIIAAGLAWGPIRIAAASAAAALIVSACYLASRRRFVPAAAIAAIAGATLPLWVGIPAPGIAAAALISFLISFRAPAGADFLPGFVAGLLLVLAFILGFGLDDRVAMAAAAAFVIFSWMPVRLEGVGVRRAAGPLAPGLRAALATACVACGSWLGIWGIISLRPAPIFTGPPPPGTSRETGAPWAVSLSFEDRLPLALVPGTSRVNRALYRLRIESIAPPFGPPPLPLLLKVDHLLRYDGQVFARAEGDAPDPPATAPAWRADVEVLFPVGPNLPHAMPATGFAAEFTAAAAPGGRIAAERPLRTGDRYRFEFGGPWPPASAPPPAAAREGGDAAALRDLARDAGADGLPAGAAAARLAEYLRRRFTYDDQFIPDAPADPIGSFLRARRGPCGLFAATAALALRSIGVPTRIARGFLARHADPDGSIVVAQRDGHAWLEVLAGEPPAWTAFEVTPRSDVGEAPVIAQEVPEERRPAPGGDGWLAVAAAAAGAVILLALGARIVRGGRRRRPLRRGARTPLEHLLEALAASGHPRRAWRPVLAHIRALPDPLRAEAPDIESAIAAYYGARFGGGPEPPDLAHRLEETARRIRTAARGRLDPSRATSR
ncbi:MAG: DUF58 domain-containing protein [Planctomycetes bacterium]|nr:DUF58 domain-containing protein [Planctomycetota bacterium]